MTEGAIGSWRSRSLASTAITASVDLQPEPHRRQCRMVRSGPIQGWQSVVRAARRVPGIRGVGVAVPTRQQFRLWSVLGGDSASIHHLGCWRRAGPQQVSAHRDPGVADGQHARSEKRLREPAPYQDRLAWVTVLPNVEVSSCPAETSAPSTRPRLATDYGYLVFWRTRRTAETPSSTPREGRRPARACPGSHLRSNRCRSPGRSSRAIPVATPPTSPPRSSGATGIAALSTSTATSRSFASWSSVLLYRRADLRCQCRSPLTRRPSPTACR